MRRIFCDVCGDEIADKLYDGLADRADIRRACPDVKDVCPSCASAAKALDVQEVVLECWRGKSGKKAKKPRKAEAGKAGTAASRRKAPRGNSIVPVAGSADTGVMAGDDAGTDGHSVTADGPGSVQAVQADSHAGCEVRDADASGQHELASDVHTVVGQPSGGAGAAAGEPVDEPVNKPAEESVDGSANKPVEDPVDKPKRRGRPRKARSLEPPDPDEPSDLFGDSVPSVPRKVSENASDKARIMRALVLYRAEKGVGSLNALAEAANVTSDQLRRAIAAERFEFDWWKQVEEGLVKLGRDVHPFEL